MKVFLSSVIGGLETDRDAAAQAAANLGHQVVRAEDFPSAPDSPRRACLAAARRADVVILILGDRYGAPQAGGLSATHEEYREAREHTDVLAFIRTATKREPEQERFIDEVRSWETGTYTAGYSTSEELAVKATRALHELELARATGPVDETEIVARAEAALSGHGRGQGPILSLVVSGGPRRQILRPSEIEDPLLARTLKGQALFGDHPVLDPSIGTNPRMDGHALRLEQEHSTISLDELGTLLIEQPARREAERGILELPTLIEEEITHRLVGSLRFVAWALDHVDAVRRLSDVVVVAAIAKAGYLPWRSRAEHERSPTSGSVEVGHASRVVARLTPARRHRAALSHQADQLAEDLTVLLRRAIRGGSAPSYRGPGSAS